MKVVAYYNFKHVKLEEGVNIYQRSMREKNHIYHKNWWGTCAKLRYQSNVKTIFNRALPPGTSNQEREREFFLFSVFDKQKLIGQIVNRVKILLEFPNPTTHTF